MFQSDGVITIVCAVNDKFKICRPLGYKPVTWGEDADKKVYLNGFRVVYPELGEFEGKPEDNKDDCVYYRHLKSGRQIIEFVSIDLGNNYFYIVLEGITVHDHASIPQGGPAYATYYSESGEGEEGS